MATSLFRRKNRQIVAGYVDELIAHLTGLPGDDENFEIARRFIWSRLDNNSFPDTDESLVKSQISQINEKLVLHSQDDRAQRLKYLIKEFKARKTLKQVGISDSHSCMIQLLMCLSVNPTGAGGNDAAQGEHGSLLAGQI